MVGDNATGTIDAANNNTGLGIDIFTALTTGDSNSALGTFSLELLTTGTGNSGVGLQIFRSSYGRWLQHGYGVGGRL